MRITNVPTWEQMRVLADRAEQGLTPAEADRLRAGIRAAELARRSTAGRMVAVSRQAQQQGQQLAALRELMRRTRYRGASKVTLWALGQALDPGQRPPAATSVGVQTASGTAGLTRTDPEKGAVRPPKALPAVRWPSARYGLTRGPVRRQRGAQASRTTERNRYDR